MNSHEPAKPRKSIEIAAFQGSGEHARQQRKTTDENPRQPLRHFGPQVEASPPSGTQRDDIRPGSAHSSQLGTEDAAFLARVAVDPIRLNDSDQLPGTGSTALLIRPDSASGAVLEGFTFRKPTSRTHSSANIPGALKPPSLFYASLHEPTRPDSRLEARPRADDEISKSHATKPSLEEAVPRFEHSTSSIDRDMLGKPFTSGGAVHRHGEGQRSLTHREDHATSQGSAYNTTASTEPPRETSGNPNDMQEPASNTTITECGAVSAAPVTVSRSSEPARAGQVSQSRPLESADGPSTIHKVAHSLAPAKVVKVTHRSARRAQEPIAVDDLTISSIDDYLQIAKFKHLQSQKVLVAKVQQSLDTQQELSQDLQTVTAERDQLSAALEVEQTRLVTYERRLGRFKLFVEGLGKDVDALHKQAGRFRDASDTLRRESAEAQQERSSLAQKLSACAERSSQLRDEAIKACQDAFLELEKTKLRCSYLDEQLNEKVGLLAEERDRSSSLERRLAAASGSDDRVGQKFDACIESVLSKLHDIQSALDTGRVDGLEGSVQQILQLLHGLGDHNGMTVQSIECVKESIEGLTLNWKTSADTIVANGRSEDHERLVGTLVTHIDTALAELKVSLSLRDQIHKDTMNERDALHEVQNALKALESRNVKLEAQVVAAGHRTERLLDEKTCLEGQVAALQQSLQLQDVAQSQLDQISADLARRSDELANSEVKLQDSVKEHSKLTEQNCELSGQIMDLKTRLEQLQEPGPSIGGKATEGVLDEIEGIRKQYAEHTDRFERELQARADNETKKLVKEKADLEKILSVSREQAAELKCKGDSLQDDLARTKLEAEQAVARSEAAERALNCEIEALRLALEKAQALSTETETEGQAALATQIRLLSSSLESEQQQRRQAEADLDINRADHNESMQGLRAELREAMEDARRAEAGSGQLKASCRAAVDEEKARSSRQIETLQNSLVESRGELQSARVEHEAFRARIEESWQLEQERFDEQKAEAARRALDAESRRDKAESEIERLKVELQGRMLDNQLEVSQDDDVELQKHFAIAEELLRSQLPNSRNGSEASDAACIGLAASRDRALTRKTVSSTDAAGEDADILVSQASLPFDALNDDDMLSLREHIAPALEQRVRATQSISEVAPPSEIHDTALDLAHESANTAPSSDLSSLLSRRSSLKTPEQLFSHNQGQEEPLRSSVVESIDSSYNASQPLRQTSNQVMEGLTWTAADERKYSFQKPVPQCNSASKIVRGSRPSAISGQPRRTPTRNLFLQGSYPNDDGKTTPAAGSSSSPDFLHPVHLRISRTYHASNASQDASDDRVAFATDPRLAHRRLSPVTKRKLADDWTDDSQHQSKTRQVEASQGQFTEARRFNLRPRTQTASIKDLPQLPASLSGSTGSRGDAHIRASQSRMQTLGGASSRGSHGTRKSSKNDEYGARFAQELGRH